MTVRITLELAIMLYTVIPGLTDFQADVKLGFVEAVESICRPVTALFLRRTGQLRRHHKVCSEAAKVQNGKIRQTSRDRSARAVCVFHVDSAIDRSRIAVTLWPVRAAC